MCWWRSFRLQASDSIWKSLRPFAPVADQRVDVSARRDGQGLLLQYRWTGKNLPTTDHFKNWRDLPASHRRDELWRGNCFEAFWAISGGEAYQEFNLSCQGEWNLYDFANYRAEMRPAQATGLQWKFWRPSGDQLEVAVRVPVPDGPLQVSLTAVILIDEATYWALVHSRPKPDFHARESFVLQL